MNAPAKIIFVFLLSCLTGFSQNIPKVDQRRLESTIMSLAEYGIGENGETNRVAFSDADLAGRAYIISLMQVTGLDVSVDFAGNIA